MSFISTLIHRVTGAANDIAESHADLGADARQNVRDLEAQLTKATDALVEVRAEAELLKGKHSTAEAEVAKWLKAATAAAGKDDALARQCLEKKKHAADQLAIIDTQIAKFTPTVTAIEQHITQLRAKKDELANQADLIGVRSDVADVELKAAEILGGIGGHGVDMTATENALAKKEAKAHASTAILNEGTGEDLEARVAALGAASSIDDELAALKATK